VIFVIVRTDRHEKVTQPVVDTRVKDYAVQLSSAEEESVTTSFAEPRPDASVIEEPAVPTTNPARPPHVTIIPNTLPDELGSVLRHFPPQTRPSTDSNVKPAAGTTSAQTEQPMHGSMKAGQTVVYVLDCSGSMGEFGKLAAARAALIATLRRQSAEVRFQVIAYNSTARSLFPGECVFATGTNIARAEERLAALNAAGRSNHPEAVRLAANLRPDVIVLLTDADDLSAAQFKPAFAAVGKLVPVCVAKVTAEGVSTPRELR
jgi:hypothetical protein